MLQRLRLRSFFFSSPLTDASYESYLLPQLFLCAVRHSACASIRAGGSKTTEKKKRVRGDENDPDQADAAPKTQLR